MIVVHSKKHNYLSTCSNAMKPTFTLPTSIYIYIWIQSYNNANTNINMQTNKNHKIRAKRDLYLKGDQEEVSWGFLNPKIYDPR